MHLRQGRKKKREGEKEGKKKKKKKEERGEEEKEKKRKKKKIEKKKRERKKKKKKEKRKEKKKKRRDSLQASPSNWKSAYRSLWKAPVPSKKMQIPSHSSQLPLWTPRNPSTYLPGLRSGQKDLEHGLRQMATYHTPSPSASLKTLASGGSDLPPQTLKCVANPLHDCTFCDLDWTLPQCLW